MCADLRLATIFYIFVLTHNAIRLLAWYAKRQFSTKLCICLINGNRLIVIIITATTRSSHFHVIRHFKAHFKKTRYRTFGCGYLCLLLCVKVSSTWNLISFPLEICTTAIYFVWQTLMIYVAMVLIYVFLSTHTTANDTFSGIACKFHITLFALRTPSTYWQNLWWWALSSATVWIQPKLLTFYFIRLAISKIPHTHIYL